MHNVIIIGSGCAGNTAAIYSARAGLKPLVVLGHEPGGQLSLTSDVENFPGFPDGITGPALIEAMKKQAERFGAEYVHGSVMEADFSQRPFRLNIDEEWQEARTVIIASGASANMLGLKSERRLLGHGVSTCATCDGFFFRGKELVVVGGGDAAMEEATFLTKFATRVTVVHRRDTLRASKIMQDRARKNPKIEFIWNTVVEDILGDPVVTAVRLRDLKTGAVTEKRCDGVFVAIGHSPNTKLFRDQLKLDERGYILTHDGTKTSIPGVFAGGDVQDHVYRQAITAAGSGCMAAMDCERYLEEMGSESISPKP